MQAENPKALQTTYDTADFSLQWRCNLNFMMRKKVLIVFAAAAAIPSIILHLTLLHFVGIFATFLGLTLGELAISAKRRSKGPRICTTTINEHGVHDLTPDGGNMYLWREITKIDSVSGDIYFHTRNSGLFVPLTAFADVQKREEFFRTAVGLWQTYRNPYIPLAGTNASKTPSESGIAVSNKVAREIAKEKQLSDLLAEDEAVWEALEQEHKKQKENQNNS